MNSIYDFQSTAAIVRKCPLSCGWEAPRKLKSSQWVPGLTQFHLFVERCREDIAEHLLNEHVAKPYTSAENYLSSPEGKQALREAIAGLDELKAAL